MSFGHEKLDVYRVSIEYISWVYTHCEHLSGTHRHARDQILRASQSIPLNIAEGNGKATTADRRKYFEISRGSALECAAIQDVLEVRQAIKPLLNKQGKHLLDRIVAMLTRLGGRSYSVHEPKQPYIIVSSSCETDTDSDSDAEGEVP